jgi:lipoyl synthase
MPEVCKKPPWLKKPIRLNDCRKMDSLLRGLRINTVCRKALCPNIGECFLQGQATFLILGDCCTRECTFCNVPKGKPQALDPDEPARVKKAVEKLGLKHVVITSVTRDDMADGGSGVFAQTVQLLLREGSKDRRIELLIPDFLGEEEAVKNVVRSDPDIIGHNLETVPRLYPEVRLGSSYERSLKVLETVKRLDSRVFTKSGLMLGLGEREPEVLEVLRDLRKVKCDFLSLGQYLSAGEAQYPVQEYISPEAFEEYKHKAMALGFSFVASGPYVRSSYLAHEYLGS